METQLLNFITLSNIFSCCFNNNAEPITNTEELNVDTSSIGETNVIEEPIVNTINNIYTCERCGRTGSGKKCYNMPIGMQIVPFSWENFSHPRKTLFFHLHDDKIPIFLDPYGIPLNFNRNGSASFKSTMNENATQSVSSPSMAIHICNIRYTN